MIVCPCIYQWGPLRHSYSYINKAASTQWWDRQTVQSEKTFDAAQCRQWILVLDEMREIHVCSGFEWVGPQMATLAGTRVSICIV